MAKLYLIIGSVFCLLSVALGAFAAHGLKGRLSDYAIGIFNTAAQYQMTHGLAIIATAFLIKWGLKVQVAGGFFIAGVLLFSGSLYLLALTGMKWLGPITPIGGTCFLIAWILLIVQAAKSSF
ncbi:MULTISPECIES: DUF423 domain-containing protein [Pseudoalteromonas]|uniref:DUF423 domain-containing protein n=1 Tax=Pseudoalteromonas maricaloris TaxID=184924 RepID=A0A8I2KR23_9GAMM|nr:MULTISPECIES: DUF423 domain-containing protein [Pseudoalteromonas]KID38504.1 membrane protein [Pseudoalteromonas flavipulchra NCIMB 2033 = ATCC BAA-314]KJY97057.1 membrane protein [Pseudoalteromonas piscicida]MBD0783251.1 DUF423 domain-containing protein [Pseudoalteromonas flavipulchra]MBE0371853.1 hypothetical protein [Pseudoalteromonas flavipulchra NCIMB 2033 = ATCC BAA-314]MCO7200740.1 DUF423 domain-containing protein [Pseudoalteromonas sp. OANN1]